MRVLGLPFFDPNTGGKIADVSRSVEREVVFDDLS
jgi:hypothetical protein